MNVILESYVKDCIRYCPNFTENIRKYIGLQVEEITEGNYKEVYKQIESKIYKHLRIRKEDIPISYIPYIFLNLLYENFDEKFFYDVPTYYAMHLISKEKLDIQKLIKDIKNSGNYNLELQKEFYISKVEDWSEALKALEIISILGECLEEVFKTYSAYKENPEALEEWLQSAKNRFQKRKLQEPIKKKAYKKEKDLRLQQLLFSLRQLSSFLKNVSQTIEKYVEKKEKDLQLQQLLSSLRQLSSSLKNVIQTIEKHVEILETYISKKKK